MSEMNQFLEAYFYSPKAFLISEVLKASAADGEISAVCFPKTSWLVAPYQTGSETQHPRHVSGPDLIMLTASLGSLHAYFFHGCKWQDGWVGYGSRMEKVDFHNLARIDLPLNLYSKETRVRRGSRRTLIHFNYQFSQNGKLIYTSQQMALFVKSVQSNSQDQS